MYVDESGDPGNSPLSSPHYILTGLILHQDEWKSNLHSLKILRKNIQASFGLTSRIEFHATEIFRTSSDAYKAIKKHDRIKMLKFYVNEIPNIFSNAKILNICFRKQDHPQILNFQELAWNRFLNRYDKYLGKIAVDKGIIICDESNENQLRNQLRKSRIYNPTPSHFGSNTYNSPIQNIIEDINHRKSTLSYFIQTSDIIAHCLYRKEYPKGSLRKHGVEKIFDALEPILLKEASSLDPFGIVRK
ncbi:DUF3800 domain-containing protein [Pedobacter endophyticus]|uniref:DUF3800 domain-containing protein n=1 Tax=Pedobacter endophyticus TaxID=2789740 RepID=A0A7S9Q0Z8_9SPHI|nr:DUF3800 domain-containing protein [Pedobacter endophyticus]QPH41301.1 DUF3800 domain-containing protein [Pedobacter endophyticus]